ncbi:MAG TPA: ATP-dependent 6-phosphofructokinase [Thermomicrobiales bacterium]|nr:ATP-dependent 6-phosphofructokinase [Thermomicrobiales bacterium]
MRKTIALLTGGGDCPGLNAAIRAITRIAHDAYGWRVVGFLDGFEGLIQRRYRILEPDQVRGILRIGGTILGSSNRTSPFAYLPPGGTEAFDASAAAREALAAVRADALIVIGGDGTLALAHKFAGDSYPIVGVPKTIDNDVHGTDYSIGFDTCVATVTEAIDRLHTTAESHHRVMLLEVMGRTAGWLALYAGVAGGADIALIPEREYTCDDLVNVVESRRGDGKHFTIAAVSEGVAGPGGEAVYRSTMGQSHEWRLGGVCDRIASELSMLLDRDVRAITLGHLQRGGTPTPTDRVLATRLAHAAVEALKADHGGVMAGVAGESDVLVPLDVVAQGPRNVPEDHPLIRAAAAIGMYVG